MAQAQDSPERARTAFLCTGLSILSSGTSGRSRARWLGGGIGDPRDLGMDAMFPAAFLALLAPQLRRPGAPGAAVIGGLIAGRAAARAPTGLPIVAAIGALIPAAASPRRRRGCAA